MQLSSLQHLTYNYSSGYRLMHILSLFHGSSKVCELTADVSYFLYSMCVMKILFTSLRNCSSTRWVHEWPIIWPLVRDKRGSRAFLTKIRAVLDSTGTITIHFSLSQRLFAHSFMQAPNLPPKFSHMRV
jgi:hypothetical protein